MCVGAVTRFPVPLRLPQELNEPVLAELALRQRHSAVDDAGVEASPPAAAATLVDVASHVHSDTGGHAPGHGGYTPGEMSTLGELQHFATSWFASLAAGTTAADGVFMMDDAASLSTGGGGGGGAGSGAGAGVSAPNPGVLVAEAVVFVLDETATASAPQDAPGNGAGFVAVCGEAAARGVLRKLGGRAVRVPSPQQQQHDAVMVSVPCHGLLEEVRRTKTLTRWVCLRRWCSVGSTVRVPPSPPVLYRVSTSHDAAAITADPSNALHILSPVVADNRVVGVATVVVAASLLPGVHAVEAGLRALCDALAAPLRHFFAIRRVRLSSGQASTALRQARESVRQLTDVRALALHG